MIFTKGQIEQTMEMIDFQHLHFCVYNVGVTTLSREDRTLLKKYGIDVSKLDLPKYTPSKKAFLFGRLAAALKDQTTKIDYNDFQKYLRRGQFIPLSEPEKEVLQLFEERLTNSIKKQSEKVKSDIRTLYEDRNLKWNMEKPFKDLVKKEVKQAIIENKSKQEVVLEIGNKTGVWERDLGRIVETELQDIYQYGKASAMAEKSEDEETLVYKKVYPGACRFCISLYLTGGVGSTPKIFKLKNLIANGTNIGRKQNDWKPVVGTTHPFCRCELEEYRGKDVWDEEKQTFVIPKSTVEESQKIEGRIVIEVGDKKFYS